MDKWMKVDGIIDESGWKNGWKYMKKWMKVNESG